MLTARGVVAPDGDGGGKGREKNRVMTTRKTRDPLADRNEIVVQGCKVDCCRTVKGTRLLSEYPERK